MLWALALACCAPSARHDPLIFRVFSTANVTARTQALWHASARLSGVPLHRHRLVVDGSPFATDALARCNVTGLYAALVAPAFRGDLMRYCILYLYGGMYLDLMAKLTHPAARFFSHDLVVVNDIPRSMYWNGFMAGRRGHPAFKRAMRYIRWNVRRCKRTSTPLGVTGPALWHQAASRYRPVVAGTLRPCDDMFEGCRVVDGVFMNKMPDYNAEFARMGYKLSQKYTSLWNRGIIYDDKVCKLYDFASLFHL